jgi:glycosyltransferase involved in cell wall biosynthesis
MNPKKILFISHDANRAGSQLLLLQLLRLLKGRCIPMHLLLCGGGDLEEDFAKVVSITKYYVEPTVKKDSFLEKVQRKLGINEKREESVESILDQTVSRSLATQNIGLIFVNSIANAQVYHEKLGQMHHLPMVLFLHELGMSAGIYTKKTHLDFLLSKANEIIAVSQAVANHYIQHYHYPAEQVHTFTLIDHESVDRRLKMANRNLLHEKYKIPEEAIVIGGCGNAEWRKGNDVFNWIAQSVLKKANALPIYFVWIGAGPQHAIFNLIANDIKSMGLTDQIILIPPTAQALSYISRFDIFLLCSREDPYPLVVLEAALCEVPVVCFEGAGGAPELVESDAGMVVNNMDIQDASDALMKLALHPELRSSMGSVARQKVLLRHNTEQSVDRIESIINKYLPLQVSEKHHS